LFFDEGKMPGTFCPPVFLQTWSTLIKTGVGRVLAAFTPEAEIMGILAFIVSPDLWTGEKQGVECAWFMLPQYRGGKAALYLLNKFEADCKELGCHQVAMIHLETISPKALEKLYLKRGYRLVEKHYIRHWCSNKQRTEDYEMHSVTTKNQP
jgi:hypothetical protein